MGFAKTSILDVRQSSICASARHKMEKDDIFFIKYQKLKTPQSNLKKYE